MLLFLMLSQELFDFFGSSTQLYILLSYYLRFSPFYILSYTCMY